ncbi:DUF1385 domain-containing protein [Domibacillus sp. DTU_2020_1001157_1_SI_ALB_TIR_016]|uniref:DUF1385 domain-containing protein n=1 Tax=Domibacillus sp. DTU_2020_1001157_1_SI_ALB_TIR_016 TaxID=3077789 RepID=UPI0028EBAA6C|nr:DUF1385 domain-containing protein [Domibacillus sp. DTU_2020_1001157_1_SI_ALB_TIR_016]WNS82182.1 DUF1385 domain-containing protein [Domibacillus sp. DTU_2020_1001157_1_SI_ALB_TIR_016]
MSSTNGGRAGFHSVLFYNNTRIVKATRERNKRINVKVTYIEKSKIQMLGLCLYEIPFVRGAWLFFESFIITWKINFVLISALFLLNIINWSSHEEVDSSLSPFIINFGTSIIYDYRFHFSLIMGFLLLSSLIIKTTNLGKYHGAEHMVDNAYEDSKNITFANVINYSRIHPRCGTNIIVFVLIFYTLLYSFVDIIFLRFILSFILAYEVYLLKNKKLSFFLKPVYRLGEVFQKYLFTSLPEKTHIEVAIAAYDKLLTEESKNESKSNKK